MASSTIGTNLQDSAMRAQDIASDLFRTGRSATADALESAAIRMNAGTDSLAHAGHATADRLDASATYMRENGAKAMVGDIESMIKAHPGKFLLGAVVVGFLAGRAFRRD